MRRGMTGPIGFQNTRWTNIKATNREQHVIHKQTLIYRKLILKGMNYFINGIRKYVFEKESFTFLLYNKVNSR